MKGFKNLLDPRICKYVISGLFIFSIPVWGQWQDEKQLTDNFVEDKMPDVYVNYDWPQVIWISNDSVMLASHWDGTAFTDTMKVNPDSIINNAEPSINEAIVWQAQNDSGFEIYYWEVHSYPCTTLVRIAFSNDTIRHPYISNYLYSDNRAVVREGWDGNDWEIYFRRGQWQGDSIVWGSISSITDNDYDDRHPSISSQLWDDSIWVVWERFDGKDYEIIGRVYNDIFWEPEIQLSEEDSLDDINPRVTMCPTLIKQPPGICVVWEGYDGNDWEVYYRFGYHPGGGVEEAIKTKSTTPFRLSCYRIAGSRRIFISYYVPYSSYVSLIIYDAAGRVISRLVDGFQERGEKEIIWEPPTTGVYFIQLRSGKYVEKRKITVLD